MSADSAGVECGNGLPAAENAVTVTSERGLDIAGHRSKDLEDIDLSQFDIVVAMTPSIATSVARFAPRCIVTWSVKDPYRCPLEQYRAVADEIDENLDALSLLEHDAN
jgi:protein-tyrosine-phosphatase